jgi:L,D-transpeptidase catalytic domain/Putative peptidoglycan binding domain
VRAKLLIGALAATALVVLAGAGALYAYDASRSDVIAEGVSVAKVDVGGLSASSTRRLLRTRLAPRLQRPVLVVWRDRRWRLSPRAIRLRADVDGMVSAALSVGRHGTFIGRALRDLRGDAVHARIAPLVDYTPGSIASFARNVAGQIDRRARSATVTPSAVSLSVRGSRVGFEVRQVALARRLARAVRDVRARRVVSIPIEILRPNVTTAQLVRRHPWFITISRDERRLRLFHRLRLFKTYTIAVGQIGLETPAGLYHIDDKQVDPSWHVPDSAWAGSLAGQVIPPGPDDPLKARWLGFYDGAGIHGTDDVGSLGSAASHGCIRMSIADVIELYSLVPLHAPIYVD